MSKTRGYCFTINNWTDDDCLGIMEMCEYLEVQYLIAGFEVGEQGTPHIQGYVYFKNPCNFSHFNEYIPRAHNLVAKGSAEHNETYCSKEGNAWVYGEVPTKGRATWDKIEDAMNDPRSNPHLYNQYKKSYDRIINDERAKVDRVTTVEEVEFIDDDLPFAHDETVGMYDTYNGEDVCIMDPIEYAQNRLRIRLCLKGIPIKIRRGYELITFNPRLILIVKNAMLMD